MQFICNAVIKEEQARHNQRRDESLRNSENHKRILVLCLYIRKTDPNLGILF
jgi:hypothetical protein